MMHFPHATFVLSLALACLGVSACADHDSSLSSEDRLEINPEARTVATSNLTIEASPSEVWAVLVDVDRWTEWLPFERAHLEGPLEAGSVIRWSVTGEPIDSRLVLVEPERRLVWNGTDGAVHVWELDPTEEGTLLHNNESIDDWQENTGDDSSEDLEMTLEGWNQLLAQRVHALREVDAPAP